MQTKYVGFKVNSEAEHNAARAFLAKLGVEGAPYYSKASQIIWFDPHDKPARMRPADNGSIVGNSIGKATFADFLKSKEGLALLPAAPAEVKLNKAYTAIVSDKDVSVGCQSFSHDVVLSLAAAVKAKKENRVKAK